MNEPNASGDRATAEVRRLIRLQVAGDLSDAALAPDVPLGPDGVGLDSVGVVELIVGCESFVGARLPQTLLDGGVTVGSLAGAMSRAMDEPRHADRAG